MRKLSRRDFLRDSSVAAGLAAAAHSSNGQTSSFVTGSEAAEGDAEVTFYVSPGGNDVWSGKLAEPNALKTDGPFATIARARDAIRAMKGKQPPRGPVAVLVRGGKYYLDEALLLGPEDSGSRDFPVTYRAYPGEKPVLSGGRKLSGWKPYRGKILQASVPQAKGGRWKFRQLFLDGQRQIRARYPNFDPKDPLYGGWAAPEGEGRPDAFTYRAGTFPRRWAKPQQGEVFLIQDWGMTDRIPIKSIDESRRTISLVDRMQDVSGMPYMYFQPPFHETIGRGFHFYVENLLAVR